MNVVTEAYQLKVSGSSCLKSLASENGKSKDLKQLSITRVNPWVYLQSIEASKLGSLNGCEKATQNDPFQYNRTGLVTQDFQNEQKS